MTMNISLSFSQQFYGQDNEAKDKNEQADTVDTMHITYPLTLWTAWIFFFQVKVFRYLSPDSHTVRLMFCKIKTDKNSFEFVF